MKILITSISDRKEMYDITFTRFKEYCDKHNYDLSTYNEPLDTTRHIAWSKITVLQNKMRDEPNYDYYIWIDDDIYITDINKSIEELLKPYPFENILMSADVYPAYPLNSGFIVCKNNKFVEEFFKIVWTLGPQLKKEWEHGWEQDAITLLYRQNMDKIKIVPHTVIQSFYRDYGLPPQFKWKQGHFSAHVTGMPLDKRLKILAIIKNICEKNENKKEI